MPMLSQYWKSNKKSLIYTFMPLCLFGVIYAIFLPQKFYGFEYEDCFVNSSLAIEESFSDNVDKFRTYPTCERVNGINSSNSSFTGHYIPYAFTLWGLNQILNVNHPYLLHKIANSILLLTSLLISIIFIIPIKYLSSFSISFTAILISTPFIYLVNSSLIENLSISIGTITILLFLFKPKSINTLLVLAILLSLVKRENLVYLILPVVSFYLDSRKNVLHFIWPILFITIQFLINPFYTEGLESESLGRSTFSFQYFRYQAPVYFKAFLIPSCFLPLAVLLAFSEVQKKVTICIMTWVFFVLLYAFHYRSSYSIISKEISIFDSYRYMCNTLPFLLGAITYGLKDKFSNSSIFMICSFALLLAQGLRNKESIKHMIEEEYLNYHYVSDYISEHHNNSIVIDNFSLLSKLNLYQRSNNTIDILQPTKINTLKHLNKPILIINRFNDFELQNILSPNDTLTKLNPNFLFKVN